MKTVLIAVINALLGIASANAQYIVYDPTLNTQTAMNQVENIAKYIEMIDNQIQQINTLTSQLQELQQYRQAFGDPSKILNIVGVDGLVQDLQKTGLGQTMNSLQNLAQGAEALQYDSNGLYHDIGATFTTPGGASVSREVDTYRPFAAINQTTKNFSDVYGDVIARRKTLKLQIAATTQKLQSATTASEAQKLTGVLIGLNSALAASDKEIDQALGLSLVQDSENRNDQQKQKQARAEEQQAEFAEGIQKYGDTMKLSAEPPSFPETDQ
jgi:vacuolar-type H+-ATPase subunit I/STV1